MIDKVLSQRVKRTATLAVVAVLAIAATVGVLYLSYTLAGLLSTIIYAVLFVVGAGLLPGTIALLGRGTPMGGAVGKLHFILAQFIAGHGWFVQVGEEYHHCPGERDRFYFDGEWHDVEEGDVNRTVLGWRPFGIVWLPDGDRLLEVRADTEAEVKGGAVTDGGSGVERAGVEQASKPLADDGNWLIDLKALYRSGLARAGDMGLVQTKEEQTMRDEVDGGAVDRWGAIIMFIFGLPAGAAIGYLVILA